MKIVTSLVKPFKCNYRRLQTPPSIMIGSRGGYKSTFCANSHINTRNAYL